MSAQWSQVCPSAKGWQRQQQCPVQAPETAASISPPSPHMTDTSPLARPIGPQHQHTLPLADCEADIRHHRTAADSCCCCWFCWFCCCCCCCCCCCNIACTSGSESSSRGRSDECDACVQKTSHAKHNSLFPNVFCVRGLRPPNSTLPPQPEPKDEAPTNPRRSKLTKKQLTAPQTHQQPLAVRPTPQPTPAPPIHPNNRAGAAAA